MSGSLVRFPWRSLGLQPSEGRAAAEQILATPLSERAANATALHLEDPEQLLSLCEILHGQIETSPATVCANAEFSYGFLETPKRAIGSFDEREYFLGEFALLAGAACRVLARRSDARRWFDRAEVNFVLVANASAHIARLAYQRMALRLEERQFDQIFEFAPIWCESFLKLGLTDDALKCRFLEAIALKETERYDEAIGIFREIVESARSVQNERLAAIASENLFQIHAYQGDAAAATDAAEAAAPILKSMNNRVGLAKLQLGLGFLLRSQGNRGRAIEAYRAAQLEFQEIGMQADVAAMHLVLADLLVDAGQSAQAEWEVRAALPVIDELQLVPEGIAALSLLRESLRRRQIDRQALRSLNGYFEDLRE